MRSIIKDDITLHVTALTWHQKGLLCKKNPRQVAHNNCQGYYQQLTWRYSC